MNNIEDLTDYTYIYVVADGFYTNAFLKTEEQILKHKILMPYQDTLDNIPITGLEKILKASENQTILVENASCNLVNGKTIMEMIIENNWDTSNLRFIGKNTYKNTYKTKNISSIKKDTEDISLNRAYRIKSQYIEDESNKLLTQFRTLIVENLYRFRDKVDIEECNKTYLNNKKIRFERDMQRFKQDCLELLEKNNVEYVIYKKVSDKTEFDEIHEIMIKTLDVAHQYLPLAKNIIPQYMHQKDNLSIIVSRDGLIAKDEIHTLNGINTNNYNIYDTKYYRITIEQLVLATNDSIESILSLIARSLNIARNKILKELRDNNDKHNVSKYYDEIWQKRYSGGANTEALNDYIYKLLCVIKELNKHGILVEEINRMMKTSFLIPRELKDNQALQLILDVFKKNELYNTIWRAHILPLNQFSKFFIDDATRKIIYLKEIT